MEKIFLKLSKMIKEKKTTQKGIAVKLCTAQSNISAIISNESKPSRALTRLAEIIYGNEKQPHPEDVIQKTILLMEGMDKDTQENAYEVVFKEKLFEEIKEKKRA